MTIGIAAHALHSGMSRLVLCCDLMAGDDYSSSETFIKLDEAFAPGLVSIVAGPLTDARDLKRLCKTLIANNRLERYDLQNALEDARHQFEERLIKKKREWPAVELLVCGFLDDGPGIFHVDYRGVLDIVDPAFGVIGIGGLYADPLLRWRSCNEPLDPLSNVHDVIYRVYEAKRFSETSKDVGRLTTLAVMRAATEAGNRFVLGYIPPRWLDFLADQFQRLGPQKLPEKREYLGEFPHVIADLGGHGWRDK